MASFSDLGVLLGEVSRQQIIHTTKNPLKAQNNVLKKIVRRNKNCELGKKLGLKDIHSIKEYQDKVPLSTYADYEPYVDRMMNNGEKRLMFNGLNLRYASSSGSVGKPKMLPKGLNDLWKMQCIGFSVSVTTAYHHLKKQGKRLKGQLGPLALNLSGHKTADGKMSNGAAQIPLRMLKPILPFFCTSPIPLLFPSLDDKFDTSYLHLRFCLENKKVTYLGSIVVTLLTQMFDYLEDNWEMLCDDIEKGIINPNIDCTEEFRKKYAKKFKPNPERAAELRREFEKGFDDPIAPRIWPNLQWAYGMMSSNLAIYAEKLRKAIGPDVPIHRMGYAAAEGYFATPMELDVEDYVAIPYTVFFEFLPIEEDEEKADDSVRPLLLNELEVGKMYEMIVSNFSGLYRYKMEDVIVVTGMYNNTPRIKLCFRQNLSMNVANEKTTTDMTDAAVAQITKEVGVEYQGFSFYPDFTTKPPRYTLLIELKKGEASEENREALIQALDNAMDGINEKYYKYRRWGMLGRPEVLFLKEGAYVAYNKYLADKGVVLNQIKPVTVINNEEREQFFFSQVATDAPVVKDVLAKANKE
ncbi:MAG: GH3 auxin-responsive promoter family protein [Clostridia bacterium]|nr:GH3 auxin-responsive promoter family protein [Clostridia bacterium]